MKNRILFRFSLKNRKANKMLQIPFILSTGTMFALFYIMISLLNNTFVVTRHGILPRLISIGITIIGIFTLVFVLYANQFLMKRRNKEFALYGILGLEKKHVSRILLFEQIENFIEASILSIIGGYLVGKFIFLGLNTLMKEKQVTLMDYPFCLEAAKKTIFFMAILFTFTYIINRCKIQISNPIELLTLQKSREKEPKLKLGVLIFGILFLSFGYFIALSTEGLMEAFTLFFVSVICVMIGTYLLFMSLSIFILKKMKKNKKYYYKQAHFLSTSGMLYRMKANAVGIASICILCTGIIIVLGTTLTLYNGIEESLVINKPFEYDVSNGYGYDLNGDYTQILEAEETMKNTILETETGDTKLKDISVYGNIFVPAVDNNGKVLERTADYNVGMNQSYYLIIETLSEYKQGRNKELELEENEIYMTANVKNARENKKLNLAGNEYTVKILEESIPGNIAINCYYIVVRNKEELIRMANFYKTWNRELEIFEPSKFYISGAWNAENIDDTYRVKLRETFAATSYKLEEREIYRMDEYELNGGFLFLGMVIGLIFLIGTVLVIYYKQVAEGYEDRDNYQIMKKVGLPDSLIKKTANTQIVWMFLLPILVATIHTCVASKILFQLLGLFGIKEVGLYVSSMAIVIGLFAFVYLMVFLITSKIYYQIVD